MQQENQVYYNDFFAYAKIKKSRAVSNYKNKFCQRQDLLLYASPRVIFIIPYLRAQVWSLHFLLQITHIASHIQDLPKCKKRAWIIYCMRTFVCRRYLVRGNRQIVTNLVTQRADTERKSCANTIYKSKPFFVGLCQPKM